MAKLANIIDARGLTQAQAGEILHVPQSRVSDLMRGKTEKFTIDRLVYWLGLMQKTVSISIEDSDVMPETLQSHNAAEEAIKYLTRTINLDPTNAIQYQNRGDAYVALKQFDLAVGDYTRCIELSPDRQGARIQRIDAYRKSGQYQAALHDCNEIILRFGEGYAARALIYELLGDNERALADHDRDIETSGENSGSLWNRGTLYERLGRLDLALADYSRAFKLNPHLTFIGEAIATLKEKLQECV